MHDFFFKKIYIIYHYRSVDTQQSSYNILFLSKLFHAFMQSWNYIPLYLIIQAAVHFMDSISGLVAKATTTSQKAKAVRKLENQDSVKYPKSR